MGLWKTGPCPYSQHHVHSWCLITKHLPGADCVPGTILGTPKTLASMTSSTSLRRRDCNVFISYTRYPEAQGLASVYTCLGNGVSPGMTSLRSPSNERKVWDQTTQARMVWGTRGLGVLHTGVLVSVLFLLGGVEWPLGFTSSFLLLPEGAS